MKVFHRWDRSYRLLLSQWEAAGHALGGHLTDVPVPHEPPSSVQRLIRSADTFVTSAGGQLRQPDLVWRYWVGELEVLTIFEFTSRVERGMPWRLLEYAGLVGRQRQSERKTEGVHPWMVTAMVFYNGEKPWDVARSTLEWEGLAGGAELLGPWEPLAARLRCTVLDMKHTPLECWPRDSWIWWMLRIEQAADGLACWEMLPELARDLRDRGTPELEAAFAFFVQSAWLPGWYSEEEMLAMKKVERVYNEMRPLVERWLEEQRAKALKEGHRRGVQEGRRRGLQEGHRRGVQEGHRRGLREGHRIGLEEGLERGRRLGVSEGLRTALERVLAARFGPIGEDVVARLKRADEHELGVWLERAARAASLEEVFESGPQHDDES